MKIRQTPTISHYFISFLHKENNNNIRERERHTLGLDLFVFVEETIALQLHVSVAILLPQVPTGKQVLLFFG
jgi:hypothetical protein